MSMLDERTERNLIGACLQSEEAQKQLARLTGDEVYDEELRSLLSAMLTLSRQGKTINIESVTALVPGVLLAAMACVRETPSPAIAESAADNLLRRKARRTVTKIAADLARNVEELEPADAAERAMDKLRRIGTANADAWRPIGTLAGETFDVLNDLARGEIEYHPTGLPSLDANIGGFFPGELTVLGARPAVGKSALAASIAFDLAKRGERVAVCSLEMTPHQYVRRLISAQAGVDGRKLRLGRGLTTEDWESIASACDGMLARAASARRRRRRSLPARVCSRPCARPSTRWTRTRCPPRSATSTSRRRCTA